MIAMGCGIVPAIVRNIRRRMEHSEAESSELQVIAPQVPEISRDLNVAALESEQKPLSGLLFAGGA